MPRITTGVGGRFDRLLMRSCQAGADDRNTIVWIVGSRETGAGRNTVR
jgi:hypothetical protein